jgi:hypothetical protein
MPEVGGDLVIISLFDDDGPSGLRVDHADPVVQFHSSFMRDIAACPSPYVSLTDSVLTIQAVNGTSSYRLRDGWQDERRAARGARRPGRRPDRRGGAGCLILTWWSCGTSPSARSGVFAITLYRIGGLLADWVRWWGLVRRELRQPRTSRNA